jgi:hypothetical protein
MNELPPIVLKHSHIWVHYHAGTNALLSKEEQDKMKDGKTSILEAAIVSIPKDW